MTGRSGPGEAAVDLALARAATHGADLHHLAAMLTSSTDSATALVARTLLVADDGDDSARLQTALVRTYLRTAPRRRERVETSRPRDAGDVLRALRPRARAAAALRLVQGWDSPRVAAAVGVRPHRVDTLVPATPGLGAALAAVADQHALTGAELDRELGDELRAATPAPPGTQRRRRWWVAAAVPLAVLVGWAAVTGGPGGTEDRSSMTAGPDDGPRLDLTPAGWELDEDGEPPRGAMGLTVATVLTLGAGDPAQEVSWPAPMHADASFAVLWCDMPPARDANLTVPSATMTVRGDVLHLPCAGRDGSPPVTQVVPLPPGGSASVQLEGDLPPDGGATLAVYNEANSADAPLPRGSLVDAPSPPPGSVVLDPADTVPVRDWGGERRSWRAASVQIGHDSAVRVWVGRTGAVSVDLDGIPATDDGEFSGWTVSGGSAQRPPVDWATQRPDLRWGRWLVWVPGEVRTFAVPEQVRPGPGERTTVTVKVNTEHIEEHTQVVVLDASLAPVDTGPVEAVADPDAPASVAGYHLVGAWSLPQDGHRRELLGGAGTAGPLVPVGVSVDSLPLWLASPGVLERNGEVAQMWYDSSVQTSLEALRSGWLDQLPAGSGPLTAAAPAAPGHPDGLLLLYTPLAYEDFDFSTGAVPPGSWTVGSTPPPTAQYSGVQPLAVIGPDDVDDGRASLDLPPDGPIAARVTTQGRGRIRFLIGDHNADNLWASDGWWSSWTDEPVVSEVDLTSSEGGPERELTVVVEDYEEFTVEVLAPGHDGS